MQRIALRALNRQIEELSLKEIFKAGLLNDTSKLELKWDGRHIGFNHKKLERNIEKEYQIIHNEGNIFQKIYVINKLEK